MWIKPKRFEVGKDVFRRNKIVANLLSRTGLIEKVGSGFARMKNYCKEVNAPLFRLDVNEKYFRIEFFKSRDYLDMAGETVEKTTQKTTQKILELIEENSIITRRKLASFIGISEDGIKFHLANLKQKGLLKRVGPDKGGHWEVQSEK